MLCATSHGLEDVSALVSVRGYSSRREMDMGEKSASPVSSSNVLYTRTGMGWTEDGDTRAKLTVQ